MKIISIILLVLLGTLSSQAEPEGFTWRDSTGQPTADTASMKSKDGFGGEFILTANEQFYAEWAKPETPKIEIIYKLPAGKLLVPVVIYVNPKKDTSGIVDVTYDLEIFKPDGSLSRKIPDIVCAKGAFKAPQFNLQLSSSEVKWGAESSDPMGVWTFKIVLKDNIRGTELPLEASVEIIPEEPSK